MHSNIIAQKRLVNADVENNEPTRMNNNWRQIIHYYKIFRLRVSALSPRGASASQLMPYIQLNNT